MMEFGKPLRLARAALAGVLLCALPVSALGAELIMAEEEGCVWCEAWNETIAPIYPKTTEGKRAPLRRVDIHDDLPADLDFDPPVYYTPTFILMENGQEIGRIEGYPGEDFFWGLLGMLIEQLPDEVAKESS